MNNLEKVLAVDTELNDLFKKYDLPTTMTPFGIAGKLVEKNVTVEDFFILYDSIYFRNSLLSNENHWL